MDLLIHTKHNLLISNNLDKIWFWKNIPITFSQGCTSRFVHHFIAVGESIMELQSGNAQFGSKSAIFCPVWPWNWTDDWKNRSPLLCYFKHCASLHCHRSIQTQWSYSPETPNWGQNRRFFSPCDLEIWGMTLKNNRAPLLCHIKICASDHCHMWIQTGVTVRNRLSWVLTSRTLTFDIDRLHGHHFCQW